MKRIYNEHIIRKSEDLNGIWRFRIDPNDCGKSEQWFCGLEGEQKVTVPSVWNNTMGLLDYEGVAWYEREFFTDGGTLRFCFEGVMTEADVWLDGAYLGYHYGGFCQFDLIAADVSKGSHRLTVRVDNRFNAHSIPQARVDWYHYGGITRSVSVEVLKGLCVLNNRLEYTLSKDMNNAQCRFVLELYNADEGKITDTVSAQLDGAVVYTDSVTVEAHTYAEIVTPCFAVNNIRLWDVGAPELYSIYLKTSTDDLYDRTGFRSVEVVGYEIHINGKPCEILGVNRHEEHPDWGMAFPQGLMYRDIDIIKNMGCNTIRGSHYPNSQIFVDMLDDEGITFWSEVPFWGNGFSGETSGDPVVVERGLAMHKEMVKYYYNHPSIIIWGMHNEMQTNEQTVLDMTKLYYPFLKENGGNRLVTYATDKPGKDICFEYCDIISINCYVGWYGHPRENWPKIVEMHHERFDSLGVGDKPVIYSEFGGAAIYGQHTFDDIKGTEEYQAELLSFALQTFHNDPKVAGFYIWQFCDIRTCPQMGLDRSRGYNNKGLLNEYRRPKMSYHAVSKLYHQFAEEK